MLFFIIVSYSKSGKIFKLKIFLQSVYSFFIIFLWYSVLILISVKEDALAGTVVVQLAVTDMDTELVSSVEYYITDGDPHSQFAVRSTGQVYVARPLDRETQDSYHLTITATDAKFVASTHVHVEILDANGMWILIIISIY